MPRTLAITALTATTALTVPLTAPALAQGLPEVSRTFPDGTEARFYGQINKGFLVYDDGVESETFALIDNSNSGTRVGLSYERPFAEDWTFGSRVEVQYAPFNSGAANILDDNTNNDFDIDNNLRIAEIGFLNERFGALTLGQGSMASDGSTEVDFSETWVIAYSGVGDTAGGQFLRLADGDLSDLIIYDGFDNLDGLGRKMRVRYDSPRYGGFGIAASYGQDVLGDSSADLYDIKGSFDREYDTFLVAAALAYAWAGDDATILSGSGSVLHAPTGLNFTLAGARQDNDDASDPSYGYAKLGWITDFLEVGPSAFSVDWYAGQDFVSDGSDSESWGIAFVQDFERANTEFWAVYRDYDFGEDVAEYDTGNAVFAGLRFFW